MDDIIGQLGSVAQSSRICCFARQLLLKIAHYGVPLEGTLRTFEKICEGPAFQTYSTSLGGEGRDE